MDGEEEHLWHCTDIVSKPTLAQGQDADLKVEMDGLRVWLERTATEERVVQVEVLTPVGWRIVKTYIEFCDGCPDIDMCKEYEELVEA